jgi:hypothetical protein
MKLAFGAVAYLFFVAAVVVAAFAGLSSIERREVTEGPVLAMAPEDRAGRRERALEEAQVDPNRVPVWIVPTAKYEYTPQPIDARPKHTPGVIGNEARGAMARAANGRKQERRNGESAGRAGFVPRPGFGSSHRDNDPFFRD